jgi:hypothetical protein
VPGVGVLVMLAFFSFQFCAALVRIVNDLKVAGVLRRDGLLGKVWEAWVLFKFRHLVFFVQLLAEFHHFWITALMELL